MRCVRNHSLGSFAYAVKGSAVSGRSEVWLTLGAVNSSVLCDFVSEILNEEASA